MKITTATIEEDAGGDDFYLLSFCYL